MTSETTAAKDPVWLHCSPARTVWRRRGVGPTARVDVVHKVYVTGSTAEAEREHAMGRLAAGEGVVEYLGAGTDETTGRPTVSLRYEAGHNLDAHVALHGAVPAREALRLLLPVAETLARLHALRAPPLPAGMCHGDVKPQNLLVTATTTLLLDFEHAHAIGEPRGAAFTGGTSAFAPPEARRGAPPTAAFDVFSWGQTLAFLLGDAPPHADVAALVAAARAPGGDDRPTAAQLAARCRALIDALADDPLERVLQDWTSGALAGDGADGDDPRAAGWRARRRLLARCPTLAAVPTDVANQPDALLRQLRANEAALRRFPRHAARLLRRRELLRAVGLMLASAAELANGMRKREQFADGAAWLAAATDLAEFAARLPGGLLAATQANAEVAPGALQRTPIGFLRLLQDQLANAQGELAERVEQVRDAERALDLTRVEEMIDDLAAEYGGTSPTVARSRDQLHRLAFYLDRVARAEQNVERVGPLWDQIALRPLQDLVDAADAATESRIRRDGSAVGLRSLELTLANLREEFPHLEQVQPPHEVLRQALGHLTEQAWLQLAEAEQQLRAVPVPVRPLQLVIGRLDTFRMLEAFVDLPDRPRGELLDRLERLRLGLEQARSARDRLAENAETAMARGHWTTGLFDMERAVADLSSDDEERVEAERLRERLQAARRTKQEIETAVRRNVELTARYTALEDDAQSTSEQRLLVLEERRDCLTFLGMHVPNERAELYRKDLRTVETIIAVEQAAVAERRLDATQDLQERLRLTRDTLEQLSALRAMDQTREPSGRMLRLLEHWQTLARQCQRAVDEQKAAAARQHKQRQRMLAIAIVAVVVTTTAIGFAVRPWLWPTAVEAKESK